MRIRFFREGRETGRINNLPLVPRMGEQMVIGDNEEEIYTVSGVLWRPWGKGNDVQPYVEVHLR